MWRIWWPEIVFLLIVIQGIRVCLPGTPSKWRRFAGYRLVGRASTSLSWYYKQHLVYCQMDCKEKASCSAISYSNNWNCTMSACGRVLITPDSNSEVYIKGFLPDMASLLLFITAFVVFEWANAFILPKIFP